jgi:hypothetical protein
MTPYLVANLLTVALVYAFVAYTKKERDEVEEGRLHLLWLIALPMLLALYGLYLWGVHPLKKDQTLADRQPQQQGAASVGGDPSPLGLPLSSE